MVIVMVENITPIKNFAGTAVNFLTIPSLFSHGEHYFTSLYHHLSPTSGKQKNDIYSEEKLCVA